MARPGTDDDSAIADEEPTEVTAPSNGKPKANGSGRPRKGRKPPDPEPDEEDLDEDYDDVVDVVVMWWRDDDGDLADGLLDAIGPLTDHGVVWLMTPKPGRSGHIEAEDIADAAPTAGLQQTSTISAGSHWQGTRLVAPRAKR